MATVHWPAAEAKREGSPLRHLRDIPFLLTESECYPEGINEFIYERVRGKVRALHGADGNLVLKPLARSSAYKLAHGLADLLTWAEAEQAHPSLGAIRWAEIRAWHITDLYQDALLQGYWSAHFFATKSPLLSIRHRSRRRSALYWAASSG